MSNATNDAEAKFKDCREGTHRRVVRDAFGSLPGVRRSVPGNCYCLDCKKPIAAHWNNGSPTPAEVII